MEQADLLRGIAILMVFFYHSIIVYPINLHEYVLCEKFHSFLWVAQMPIFFFVSGFCTSYRQGYGTYATKKVRRILVPHIVFGLIDLVPRILPVSLVHEHMDWKEALSDFVLYGGSDWFLWTLFLLAMVFPVFILVYNTGKIGKLIVVLVTAGLYIFNSQLTDKLLIDMACRYLPYFLLGYMVKCEKPDFFLLCEKKWVSGLGFFMAALGFILYCERADRYAEMLCSLGVILVCSGICRFLPGQKTILSCGNWSLQMYLLNGYALVFIRTILVSIMGVSNPAVIIIVNFVFCVASCLFGARYILSSNSLFRFCCGVTR